MRLIGLCKIIFFEIIYLIADFFNLISANKIIFFRKVI